jgi:hypothetical protein
MERVYSSGKGADSIMKVLFARGAGFTGSRYARTLLNRLDVDVQVLGKLPHSGSLVMSEVVGSR